MKVDFLFSILKKLSISIEEMIITQMMNDIVKTILTIKTITIVYWILNTFRLYRPKDHRVINLNSGNNKTSTERSTNIIKYQ